MCKSVPCRLKREIQLWDQMWCDAKIFAKRSWKIYDSMFWFLKTRIDENEVSTCSPPWCSRRKKISLCHIFFSANLARIFAPKLVGDIHFSHELSVLEVHMRCLNRHSQMSTRRLTIWHFLPPLWIGGATIDITKINIWSTHTMAVSCLALCIIHSKSPWVHFV